MLLLLTVAACTSILIVGTGNTVTTKNPLGVDADSVGIDVLKNSKSR